MASFSPEEIAYEQAHINQETATTNIAVLSVFAAIAFLSVCVRLIGRSMQKVSFAWDDLLIVVGLCFAIVNALAGCEESRWGIGKHIITLTPDDFININKWKTVNLYTFVAAMTFIKLSILTFLARIFTMHNRWFQLAVWFLAGFIILWAVALYFAFSFICTPFSRNWSNTDPCPTPLSLDYAATILSTVHDVAVIILPQHIIWNLQIPLARKLAISLIFVIGIVATLMGILKITYVNGAPNTSHKEDATYTTGPALIFTSMEPLLAIVCACLPAMQSLFRQLNVNYYSQLTSRFTSVFSSRNKSGSRFSSRNKSSQAPTLRRHQTSSSNNTSTSKFHSADNSNNITIETTIDVAKSGTHTENYAHSDEIPFADLEPKSYGRTTSPV